MTLSTGLAQIRIPHPLPSSPFAPGEPTSFELVIDLPHVGPQGDLVTPNVPTATPFSPPAVFSAPLPTGSGARALSFAGAFTAVADDATAASWNPGGLIQLEHPEASVVFRYSSESQKHVSGDDDFRVGEDQFSSENLNYFTVAIPFYVLPLERNFVFSFNYQEAYDFEQRFNADINRARADGQKQNASDTTLGTHVTSQVNDIGGKGVQVVTSRVSTETQTETFTDIDQALNSSLASGFSYSQEGVVSAMTPALAVAITPGISAGAAFNIYHLDPVTGEEIRSHSRAEYEGVSSSRTQTTTTRSTSSQSTINSSLRLTATILPGLVFTIPLPAFTVENSPFSDVSSSSRQDDILVEGFFEEFNTITDFSGQNATFGVLFAPVRQLSLGGVIDLPWTATATQKKLTRNRVVSRNAASGAVINTIDSIETDVARVEFDFPLYWALGAAWHWTSFFYTTLDVSQTHWSDFAFQAEGQEKVNPLDGSPQGQNPLDDTWSVRSGAEYLFVTRKSEIPVRGGFAWEQRPALNEPDDFFSVSVGSGISFGQAPGRIYFDVAYIYTWADDVTGVVPTQGELTSDISDHQVFFSLIKHF